MVTTLGYVAGFVAVPMLVGWSVGAVAEGLPADEVLVALVRLEVAGVVRREGAVIVMDR